MGGGSRDPGGGRYSISGRPVMAGKGIIPLALAISIGLLAVVGLLFVPPLGQLLTGWATFLAGVALLLGVANIFGVHSRRLLSGNPYSGVLILSLVTVLILGATDRLGFTTDAVGGAFNLLQAPLEAAFGSLLAFFLLFAGVRLLQRQRNWWAAVFIATVVVVLLGRTPLPAALSTVFGVISDYLSLIVVSAGMRGIIIGVALGTITVSLRLLIGSERPYNK